MRRGVYKQTHYHEIRLQFTRDYVGNKELWKKVIFANKKKFNLIALIEEDLLK